MHLSLSTLNVRGPSYLSLIRSIFWLLTPWILASPGHQQPWYWLCRIGGSLSSLRKYFNFLCHTNMEEWQKCKYTFLLPLKKIAHKRLIINHPLNYMYRKYLDFRFMFNAYKGMSSLYSMHVIIKCQFLSFIKLWYLKFRQLLYANQRNSTMFSKFRHILYTNQTNLAMIWTTPGFRKKKKT